MRDPNNPCLFCTTKKEDIIKENQFAYATFDSYPISSKHCLIVPKRHIKDYFELNENEVTGCDQLIKIIKNQIEKYDKKVLEGLAQKLFGFALKGKSLPDDVEKALDKDPELKALKKKIDKRAKVIAAKDDKAMKLMGIK